MRSLEDLRQHQADLMAAYREESATRETIAGLPRPGGTTAVTVYGRVSAVVTSDPTYGPHLLVVRQRWSGEPPVPLDAAAAAVRCYPTPNRTVADYALDESVRLAAVHGGMIAERLA